MELGWWFETPWRSCKDTAHSQWTYDSILTSLLCQNDVNTSFWRNNDIIITSCVHWVVVLIKHHLNSQQKMQNHEGETWGCLLWAWLFPIFVLLCIPAGLHEMSCHIGPSYSETVPWIIQLEYYYQTGRKLMLRMRIVCTILEMCCTHTLMMTSSNGNGFRVTCPLLGKSTGLRWVPFHKGTGTRALIFSWC